MYYTLMEEVYDNFSIHKFLMNIVKNKNIQISHPRFLGGEQNPTKSIITFLKNGF